jgi:tRNA(fMet)-specific endonuclease VapC
MSRKYLLDSNAVGDLISELRGVKVRADEARKRGARIGTCPPIVGELFAGVEGSPSRDRNLKALRSGLKPLVIWPFGVEAAEQFGRLQAELRRIGRPMQVVDIQLAAVAFTLGDCTVVSSDTDLQAVPGLAVENWATG